MLDSAHHNWDGGPPPKKKNRENLKFGLKFSVLESITSGIVEVFSLKFFMRPIPLLREEFRLLEIDFALGLAAPGGLTPGSATPI